MLTARHKGASSAATPSRLLTNFKRLTAALVATFFAATGILTTASLASAETPGITASVLFNGGTYHDTQVVNEGDEVTLRVQYTDQVGPGVEVTFDLGANVTLSGVPAGNSAIASAVQDGNKLTITFSDPWPVGVQQGVFDLRFKINAVEMSENSTIEWKIDGEQNSVDVIIKNNGDDFADVNDWENKGANSTDLRKFISVDSDGKVVVDPELATHPIDYTLTMNSKEARTGFSISDQLPEMMDYVGGSFEAELTTWDENGLNKTTGPFTFAPTITGKSFAGQVDVPGPSVLKITYQANITDLASLQAALQAKYDSLAGKPGGFQISLENTATFGEVTKNASITIGNNVAAAPGPTPRQAFGKTADWTKPVYGPDNVAEDGTLKKPADIVYTLKADLTKLKGPSNFELTENVVIADTLPVQLTWNTSNSSFMTATGVTLTEAADCPSAEDFKSESYVLQYCVDGQKLLINLGKDQATTASFAVKAQLNSVKELQVVDGHSNVDGAIGHLFRNNAYFNFDSDRSVHHDWVDSTLVILPPDDGGYNDKDVFTKTGKAQKVIQEGETVTVDYTFTVAADKEIDVSRSKIVDYVDLDVFDLSDLSNIAVSGRYDWQALTADKFDVSVSAAGELVIELSDEGKAQVKDRGDFKHYEVKISLTSKPFEGKETKSIKNKATLYGEDDVALNWSETSSEVTSYGDEAEVRKRVYNSSSKEWVETLNAQIGLDGELVQDAFVYRVEFIPRGGYDQVKIANVDDVLPSATNFLGFVTEENAATGENPEQGPVQLAGNIDAVYANGIVTLKQRDGTVLDAGQPIAAYFAVEITDHTAPIINKIGSTSAEIVPVEKPSIEIEKWTVEEDSDGPTFNEDGKLTNNGYLGDFDEAPGKALEAKTDQEIVFTISNDGGEVLKDIVVSDELRSGAGSIENLVCVFPDETTGTIWEGPFAPAGQFECTGTLPGLAAGETHQNRATVTGIGIVSEDEVTDSDEWNALAKSYAVGDIVWVDANRDGVQGDAEILAGVTVNLLDGAGKPLATTTTDANGRYIFDELPAGEYQVEFILTDDQAAQYKFTTQNTGTDGAGDSDADPETGMTAKFTLDDSTVGLTKTYEDQEFTANQGIDPTWDAGVVLKTYAVGDIVWVDANRDGVQGDAEILAGVTVNLRDGAGEPLATTTTDANGRYIFDELPAGEYQVEFILTDDQAAQYKFTTQNTGTDGAGDSDADPATGMTAKFTLNDSTVALTTEYDDQTVTATEGIDPTWDAGVVLKSVSVGDFVWVDSNRDGVQGEDEPGIEGVVLELSGPDGERVTDVYGELVGSVTTDEDGKYTFDNLPALTQGQSYTVTIDRDESRDALDPYVPTIETVDSRENDSSTWEAASQGLTEDGERDSTLDFGFVLKTYAIGDIVWVDADDNGLQDDSEFLEGVKVTLFQVIDGELLPVEDVDGNDVAPQFTTAEGRYIFDNLSSGDYQVQFELTQEQDVKYIFTSLKAGEDAETDSNANPVTGMTEVITLNDSTIGLTKEYDAQEFDASQGIDPTWDAGVVVKTYAVGDVVWVDANRDGIQGDAEILEGVKVTLLNDKGDVITSTETDSKGRYIFDELPAGEYQVKFELTPAQGAKYKFTDLNSGDNAGQDSDVAPATGLTVVFKLDDNTPGLTTGYTDQEVKANQGIDPTWDAGVVLKSVSVGDFVWVDSNGDGRQDKGEPGIPGVVLDLTGPDGRPVTDVYGKPVGPVTTDKDGKYTFENLPVLEEGQSYKVSIDKQASKNALAKYLPTKPGVGDRAGDSSNWEALSQGLTNDGERDGTLDFGFILNPEFLPQTGTNPLVPAGVALLALAAGALLFTRARGVGARRL